MFLWKNSVNEKMFNYSDYTLKTFCCGIDLKTATYAIAVAHFLFLNSILYSWQFYTGEKIFWTVIQTIATISLFVGVNKVKIIRNFDWTKRWENAAKKLKLYRTIIYSSYHGLLSFFQQWLRSQLQSLVLHWSVSLSLVRWVGVSDKFISISNEWSMSCFQWDSFTVFGVCSPHSMTSGKPRRLNRIMVNRLFHDKSIKLFRFSFACHNEDLFNKNWFSFYFRLQKFEDN